MNPTPIYLFVYGTLRRNEINNILLKNYSFVGDGHIDGVMYSKDGKYPIVFSSKTNTVVGEVYEVDNNLLNDLDIHEGVPHWYRRVSKIVTLSNSKTVKANVYIQPKLRMARMVKLPGLTIVPSGDWSQVKIRTDRYQNGWTPSESDSREELIIKMLAN